MKKHINSLLLLSLWILCGNLYVISLYLQSYFQNKTLLFLLQYIVLFVGGAAFFGWTYLFIVGLSHRALRTYQHYKLAMTDLTLLTIFCVFGFLGYMAGVAQFTEQIKHMQTQLKAKDQQMKALEDRLRKQVTPPLVTPTPTPIKKVTQGLQVFRPTPAPDETPWGVAKQIGEHTWTMKIQMDSRMATPQEIFAALNQYRERQQVPSLVWDDRLAAYAQRRAEEFQKMGGLDSHAGFSEYVKNIDNVKALGYWSLGENSSYGYQLEGVHLIEWIYAGDKPHDDNQRYSHWSHVGIGVSGTATNLIFGGDDI